MCIIAIALRASSRYQLMLAANRDERHDRSAAPAGWWPDAPGVLAGRDLVARGSWLGVNRRGRLAAVTNIFEQAANTPPTRSRGLLVSEFLVDPTGLAEQSARVDREGSEYGPFNLLLYEAGRLQYVSNRAPAEQLAAGMHAFSNGTPGEDWPKVETMRNAMADLMEADEPVADLLALLARRSVGPEPASPRHSIFVQGPDFGTRCSTVVLVDGQDRVIFAERRFDADGKAIATEQFEFAPD
jgi:uncharacterized protein with NRDE domain